jgi:hypothetical protein
VIQARFKDPLRSAKGQSFGVISVIRDPWLVYDIGGTPAILKYNPEWDIPSHALHSTRNGALQDRRCRELYAELAYRNMRNAQGASVKEACLNEARRGKGQHVNR